MIQYILNFLVDQFYYIFIIILFAKIRFDFILILNKFLCTFVISGEKIKEFVRVYVFVLCTIGDMRQINQIAGDTSCQKLMSTKLSIL